MMKILTNKIVLSACLLVGLGINTLAQTPLSGFMQGKKGGNLTLSTTHEHYKGVYLYPEFIEETPIYKEVSTNSVSIYGTYGFTNKLDAIVNLPYIQTIGSADPNTLDGLGFFNSRDGIQDISAFLKYEVARKSNLSLQASVGFTTPLSDYKVNSSLESIIAIGNQATTFNGFLLAHFIDDKGFFITAQGGYSLRTTEVPDALLSELKIGFAAKRFYIAGQVGNQTSTSGVDILRPGFTENFPATKVNYTKIGGTIYTPLDGNFGLSISGGGVVDGRNVGKSYYGSAGITYNFIYRQL